jgi:hypothetical protein
MEGAFHREQYLLLEQKGATEWACGVFYKPFINTIFMKDVTAYWQLP